MATVTPGPFASYHARREQDHRATPKTNRFLPPTHQVYGGRDQSGRIFMADLEQFSEEGGRYGSRVWDVWKIRRGSSHRRSTNTQDPLPDPYPLKTIPLKCPDLVMLPLFGPLEPGSIRHQFRGCLTPMHANKDISPIKKGQSS